jgi:hypothetical protein
MEERRNAAVRPAPRRSHLMIVGQRSPARELSPAPPPRDSHGAPLGIHHSVTRKSANHHERHAQAGREPDCFETVCTQLTRASSR